MAGEEPDLRLEAGDPAPEEIAELDEAIYAFNVQSTGIGDGRGLSILLRDGGRVVGGVHGWTWGGTCFVRLLTLPPEMRGRGLGTRLMQRVEEEARARGCGQILLETHDFQAPGFYARLGFVAIAEVGEYPRGHRFLTMRKALD